MGSEEGRICGVPPRDLDGRGGSHGENGRLPWMDASAPRLEGEGLRAGVAGSLHPAESAGYCGMDGGRHAGAQLWAEDCEHAPSCEGQQGAASHDLRRLGVRAPRLSAEGGARPLLQRPTGVRGQMWTTGSARHGHGCQCRPWRPAVEAGSGSGAPRSAAHQQRWR